MKLIKIYKWKIFGWHVLASRKNIRYYPASRNDSVTARTMRMQRDRRYKKHKGCCEMCGEQYPKETMQMHHILPYAIFPLFIRKKWNLMMLCPRCHFLVHHDIPVQTKMMQRVAYLHGVNLEQEYHRSAVGFWNKKQEVREAMNKQ